MKPEEQSVQEEGRGALTEVLRQRWSPTAFGPSPVGRRELRLIFEAARWAPSSFNDQPWSFIVATRDNAASHRRMSEILMERNRTWAQLAPVLILSVARTHLARNGRPNAYALYDVGQAVADLTVQAVALGYDVHQMAGFDHARARELFAIPEGYEPVTVVALGRPVQPQRPSPPDARKESAAFVFDGSWGIRWSAGDRADEVPPGRVKWMTGVMHMNDAPFNGANEYSHSTTIKRD